MLPIDLITALPEIFLAVAATTLLMVGVFSGQGALRIVLIGAVIVLALTMALIIAGPAGGSEAFGGLFRREAYSDFMKILVLLGAGLTMVMSLHFLEREEMARFEFPVLMLFATLYRACRSTSWRPFAATSCARARRASSISSSAPCPRACCSMAAR
jgi:NADH-quinone oxidoreductase subunit N